MSGPTTTAGWFGDPQRRVAGWLTTPEAGPTDVGLLLVAPLAYEYWSTHRTLRALALTAAAQARFTALRFDLPATGSSAGQPTDGGQLDSWQAAVRAGVAQLRALGCRWVAVCGLRFGATLALTSGVGDLDAVVAWWPVVHGPRYVRELTLLGQRPPPPGGDLGAHVPAGDGPAGDGPTGDGPVAIVTGGVAFTQDTLAALRGLSLQRLAACPAGQVLLAPQVPADAALAERLLALGAEVEQAELAGHEQLLGASCERAVVPTAALGTIVDWLASHAPAPLLSHAPGELARSAKVGWDGGWLTETEVQLGRSALRGMLGRPAGGSPPSRVAVFLNCGAEHSVGPGRAWVELSRTLNVAGVASVRLDFRGWGESPPAPTGLPGVAYDPHTVDDALDVIDDLEEQGFRHIVLVGLCASSWIGLRAVMLHPISGVFALNPVLQWRRGDPTDITVAEWVRQTERRYRRIRLGHRLRLWSVLDLVGIRPPAARWLEELADLPTRVLLAYAQDDLGRRYAHERVGRRLARTARRGSLHAVTLPEVDHQMHRAWARPVVATALADFLDVSCAEGEQPAAPQAGR